MASSGEQPAEPANPTESLLMSVLEELGAMREEFKDLNTLKTKVLALESRGESSGAPSGAAQPPPDEGHPAETEVRKEQEAPEDGGKVPSLYHGKCLLHLVHNLSVMERCSDYTYDHGMPQWSFHVK